MRFEPLRKGQEALVKQWFSQDYIAKYWYGNGLDNTLATLERFVLGKEELFSLWIAYDEAVPFGYLMTSPIDNSDEPYHDYLKPNDKAISLDLLIGNKAYLGKGLAHQMIINFLQDKYQGKATKVFIDPGSDNAKAIHVYEKAGFKKISEYTPKWDPTIRCILMEKDLIS